MDAATAPRAWESALGLAPELDGRRVLDLGCGDGLAAAALAARGARVEGLDLDAARIERARARSIPGATFRVADLRAPLAPPGSVDGLWCAYAAAYFTEPAPVLRRWSEALAPGGWLLLLEVDDLFGHTPLEPRWRDLLAAFADEARAAGRYDFHLGRRLADEAAAAGLEVERARVLADPELAWDGPLAEPALDAWRARLERMALLRRAAGDDAPRLAADLLACLAHAEHRTRARVHAVLARRAG